MTDSPGRHRSTDTPNEPKATGNDGMHSADPADAVGRLQSQSPSLAQYAERLGAATSDLAERLRSRSLDQLLSDAHRAAREHTSLLLVGSFLAGFAAARFMKASSQRQRGAVGVEGGAEGDAKGGAEGEAKGGAEGSESRIEASSARTTGGE